MDALVVATPREHRVRPCHDARPVPHLADSRVDGTDSVQRVGDIGYWQLPKSIKEIVDLAASQIDVIHLCTSRNSSLVSAPSFLHRTTTRRIVYAAERDRGSRPLESDVVDPSSRELHCIGVTGSRRPVDFLAPVKGQRPDATTLLLLSRQWLERMSGVAHAIGW